MLTTPPAAAVPRGRFAPSPSGAMHIGNALAALLAWLQIRQAGGQFVLRIEDIDTARCKPAYTADLQRDLSWLGFDWDEGPDVGGPYAPYIQSERLALYLEALNRLQAEGRLYPCFCSRHDILAAAAAPHGLASEGPVYPGTCRGLTSAEAEARRSEKSPSLRFAVPPGRTYHFQDLLSGTKEGEFSDGGDFIVRRADGIMSYQLAVVVDDAMMGITDVLRGNDLADSTPRQLLLYEAFGWNPPRFAHFPLLMGPDGRRLAKRHGGIAISELRGRGLSPERIIGWLAWICGLIPGPDPVTPQQLIPSFRLEQIHTDNIVVAARDLDNLLR